ncbi:MAG TPA: UPF0182 family protein [Gemmatimonadales bacterium]|nr:UPF0182 family protein [Gemmatimonadales bacterium]
MCTPELIEARWRRWGTTALVTAGALITGHWVTVLIATRWWSETVAPAGRPFVTHWIVLRGLLEALGLIIGAGWFAGNLLVVARAIGSVELPRRIGDLDIREAVSPTAVFVPATITGAVLGLLAGSGLGRQTGAILLAWHGLHWGLSDPVLGHDASVYVAQLPLWIAALHFVTVLVAGAAIAVAIAYAALGALKVGRAGIAITDAARTHLGLLLAGVAIVFAVGMLLLPARGLAHLAGGGALPSSPLIASSGMLAVVAAAGAVLIAAWALRGRSTWLVAGVITMALVAGVRVTLATMGGVSVSPAAVRSFTLDAWGLAGVDDGGIRPVLGEVNAPTATGLWTASVLLPVGAPIDRVVAASRSAVRIAGEERRAWLVLRAAGDSTDLSVIADDQANGAGGPLSFRPTDPLAYPGTVTYAALPPGSVWPGAPDRSLGTVGVRVGGAARRLVLAWAAQAGALLAATVADSTRLGWYLDPIARLAQLFPPARWSEPEIVLDRGRVVWVVPGSVPYSAFPLAPRAEVLGTEAGGADPGLIGVIDAETGAGRIFLLPGAGPVAKAWRDIAGALIEPADSIPPAVAAGLTYPVEWLALQARILGEGSFGLPLVGADTGDLVRPVPVWDSMLAVHQVAFVDPAPPGRVVALLAGEVHDRRFLVRLLRIPAAASLPGPRRLARSWTQFASYGQVVDSIQAAGDRIIAGPVAYEWRNGRLEASQLTYRAARPTSPAVIWASVAVDRRLGAGGDLAGAWANLQGRTAPLARPGRTSDRLAQARLWVERADSALRRGDLTAFGRAFAALKELVEAP